MLFLLENVRWGTELRLLDGYLKLLIRRDQSEYLCLPGFLQSSFLLANFDTAFTADTFLGFLMNWCHHKLPWYSITVGALWGILWRILLRVEVGWHLIFILPEPCRGSAIKNFYGSFFILILLSQLPTLIIVTSSSSNNTFE